YPAGGGGRGKGANQVSIWVSIILGLYDPPRTPRTGKGQPIELVLCSLPTSYERGDQGDEMGVAAVVDRCCVCRYAACRVGHEDSSPGDYNHGLNGACPGEADE